MSNAENMNKIVNQAMLYDFYGDLLTDHQRQVYENVVFGDLSLSEAADEAGISRQGVHDIIKRCNKAMEEYDAKLGLIEAREKRRQIAEEIINLTKDCTPESMERIRFLAALVAEEA